MKKLTLLHIVAVRGTGGTGATASRMTRLLRERGHDVLMIVAPGSVCEERARRDDVPFLNSLKLSPGFSPKSFVHDVRALVRIIDQKKVDIVHVFHSTEYWLAVTAIRFSRHKPKLVRSRSIPTPIKPHFVNRIVHNRFTDMVIATAGAIRDHYSELPGFDTRKVRFILDGVDEKKFHPVEDSSDLRSELGVGREAVLAIQVARFAPVKGHKVLLDAAKIVVSKNPDVHFVLIGDGRTGPEIRAKIGDLGIGDRIHLMGRREDVEKWLPQADLFVLSSLGSEGSSRGTLEAMACGLSVTATSVGVLPDLVLEGKTGFLVPPNDPDSIADRILKLAADGTLRHSMGASGRKLIEERFTESSFLDRLESVYEEVLAG